VACSLLATSLQLVCSALYFCMVMRQSVYNRTYRSIKASGHCLVLLHRLRMLKLMLVLLLMSYLSEMIVYSV